MHHLSTSLVVISFAVLLGTLDARERMRNGQYPKRDESIENMIESDEDSGDTLLELSNVLKKLAFKLENIESKVAETTPPIITPYPAEESEELKQALAELNLSDSSNPSSGQQSLENASLLSAPKRDHGLISIADENDDKIFRRIFARWMVRDMERRGA